MLCVLEIADLNWGDDAGGGIQRSWECVQHAAVKALFTYKHYLAAARGVCVQKKSIWSLLWTSASGPRAKECKLGDGYCRKVYNEWRTYSIRWLAVFQYEKLLFYCHRIEDLQAVTWKWTVCQNGATAPSNVRVVVSSLGWAKVHLRML